MKHTKEEILNALQIIKDECDGVDCEECPFGCGIHGKECGLRAELPDEWCIKKINKEPVWRAFEE